MSRKDEGLTDRHQRNSQPPRAPHVSEVLVYRADGVAVPLVVPPPPPPRRVAPPVARTRFAVRFINELTGDIVEVTTAAKRKCAP